MTPAPGGSPEASPRLGSWRNPPLAYVVAELRISPYYTVKELVPKLQSALRESFPRTIEGSELVIDPSSPPVSQPVWQLVSADTTRAAYVSTRSLSLHATAYVDFRDFLERWSHVLTAAHSSGLNAFVERAGLRYLDLIVPSGDSRPEDYVVERLRGVRATEGARVQSSAWGATLSMERFVLQANIAAPSPEGMLFAPNFYALQLKKPRVMLEAEQRMKEKVPIGYVDTDGWCPLQEVLQPEPILELYRQLHDQVSSLFLSVLSERAKEEWK
jgi:uncharacterized protein (TIGR04255 family)